MIISFNCSISKNAQSRDTLSARSLQPIGRYRFTSDQNLELISSAVHFGFSFTGNECKIFANINDVKGHNYLQYELDGVYQKRIRVEGNSNQPFVLSANAGGRHTVWIFKATEAGTGPIFIEKIEAQNVKALSVPSAPFIEFIGNSITCGAAADASEVPCGTGKYHDQHNAYYSYASRVGRALNANYILSSVSGIGMYRNWNSDGPAMPQVYEKTDFDDNGSGWDFKLYDPKIVSIALGTNDLSNGDGKKVRLPFDSSLFVDHYKRFVQLILSKYPHTKIVLLNSAMLNGARAILLENCLAAVKKYFDGIDKEDTISIFFFKSMQGRGCGGHPNVDDHEILAQQLTPFLSKLL